MISDYASQLIAYWLKMLFVATILLGGLLGVVGVTAIIIRSNTTLKVENLPSKDGNLYHIWEGIGGFDNDILSHYLFFKNLNTPMDSTAYLGLLGTCLIYMDTAPLSTYKQFPVKEIVVLKTLDGWTEMRGYDNQDWQEIGRNTIAVIKKEENSLITTKYRNQQNWKYADYKFSKNAQGNYIFQNIK